MMLPTALNVALKEWAIVCDALAGGRQLLLLRKGGISETGGEFEVEHRAFLLFPTYLHQNPEMVKEELRDKVEPHSVEPNQIVLSSAAVVTDIVQIAWRQQIDAIDDQHIWTAPLIDMRFNYRPDRPLYLMLLRTYRLPAPMTIENTRAYWGCKSWVPLMESIATGDATPILDDAQFAATRTVILNHVG